MPKACNAWRYPCNILQTRRAVKLYNGPDFHLTVDRQSGK